MKNLKKDFPIFNQKINGYPLAYLDNASTTQKPNQVIDAVSNFYKTSNANIGRGVHTLAERATTLYEEARAAVAQFINARSETEIVFTKNATESINIVAVAWAEYNLKEGDVILATEQEHHSNMLSWLELAKKNNFKLSYIPVHDDGTLNLAKLPELLTDKVKLVAVAHVSNALGVHNAVATIIAAAHKVGAKVLIDVSQSVPHQKVDVQNMDCDFLVFSGHKMLAPTGIGVLYIKKDLHDQLAPAHIGGGMVFEADLHKASWLQMPHLLEAGTPPIAQAVGLHAAIEYLNKHVDFYELKKHEANLVSKFIDGVSQIDRIKILGPIPHLIQQAHLVSFVVKGMHPHDVAAYLDQFGIAVRAGHHCAQPLAKKLGFESSVRTSCYLYNSLEEVERCVNVLKKLPNF